MIGVYKYVYRGEVIYVGKTKSSFYERIYCHSKEKVFLPFLPEAEIFVCELGSEKEAEFIETVLINQHRPALNSKKKGLTSVPVNADIQWMPFDEYRRTNKREVKKRRGKSCVLYLDNDVVAAVDKIAKANNISRSKAMNALLSNYLLQKIS